MAKTPDMDTARIERTMRVLEYEDDKPKIKRFLEQRLEDPEGEPNPHSATAFTCLTKLFLPRSVEVIQPA
jgi:hypothetical protein